MIASGLSGPRRVSAGAAKDFVLGMTVLDAQAQALRFGGTVMKNVAGYDMSRLHTGAMGTLGLIVDVSLKVLPVPPAEATLIFEVAAQESITWTNTWAGQPLPIAATCWCDGRLYLRLAGAAAAVRAAREKLGGESMPAPAARDFWARLRDHDHDFFSVNSAAPDHHLWRLSVPSTAPHFDGVTDPQWIEWGGALRWIKTRASASALRAWASAQGGHATCFRAASDTIRQQGSLTVPDAALMKIHQRLKQELDHQRIFNPDRLYPGL
jgi:glycolate oxidase FAD binding subunit